MDTMLMLITSVSFVPSLQEELNSSAEVDAAKYLQGHSAGKAKK